MNPAEWLARTARRMPDAPALLSGTRHVADYAAFARQAFGLGAALQARGIHTRYVFVAPNREQLGELTGLIESGQVQVPLAGVLPLAEAAEAHARIESGHTAGKLVLTP